MPTLGETFKRKIGPLPVWGYGLALVPIAAWFIHRAQQQKAAQAAAQKQSGVGSPAASNLGSADNVLGLTQMAYPMPYSSDVFVNIKNDIPAPTVNVGGPTINLPRPENRPPTPTPAPPPPAPPPPPPAPPPPQRQTSITYVVKKGDTLWAIAQRFLGSGSRYNVIYQANAGTIEAIARQHGFSSSGGGHWIFPGEQLRIPV